MGLILFLQGLLPLEEGQLVIGTEALLLVKMEVLVAVEPWEQLTVKQDLLDPVLKAIQEAM
jgi:hypothetical protein